MIAAIPADIIQYYGYTLRATQKLLYLYGFPEIESDEDGLKLDSATVNEIILCLGVMDGVAGANNAVKAMAHALANGVQKQLMKKALTKGTIYLIVKTISSKKRKIEDIFGDKLDWYSSRKGSETKRIIYKREADVFNPSKQEEYFA